MRLGLSSCGPRLRRRPVAADWKPEFVVKFLAIQFGKVLRLVRWTQPRSVRFGILGNEKIKTGIMRS